ncbi:protein SOSEKI 2 [Euphorbia lathyris]|uniref:protein SOSEKI 2 n=1 Tax=Euphorbia lathyris TaxID=212925 RepID=UPI0033137C66
MDTARSRRSREESSPDRAKVCMQLQMQIPQPTPKPIKKVQVVYYLSRNGHLEHPHYMEVTHLPNHRLRLRDVMDRLTVLRGKGMPSLYSWSCKRSYRNGYVWNDLGDNDVIYPSDGAEYVLKGSEIIIQDATSNRQIIQEPSLHAKGKQLIPSRRKHLHETQSSKFEFEEYIEQDVEEESQEEYEDEEKTSCYTSSTTPHSRCSRGVSTDELEDQTQPLNKHPTAESIPRDSFLSPSIKNEQKNANINVTSKRYEDGDPVVTESGTTRNSVLLQLISCGNLAGARPKNNGPSLKNEAPKKSESNLHKGVLYKTAIKVAEEDVIIRYMSENPRFGNLQAEDKEYFSGSIVESMRENRVADDSVGLKRSNSYNEERNQKEAMEGGKEEKKEKGVSVRGKCIPRKVLSSSVCN